MILGTNVSLTEKLEEVEKPQMQAYQWFIDGSNKFFPKVDFTKAEEWAKAHRNITQIIHGPLTVNLATNVIRIRNLSMASLRMALITAEKMGVEGVITHVGSFKSSYEDGWNNVRASLEHVFKSTTRVKLIFENSGGGGTTVASDLFNLAAVSKEHDRVKICLDTAHWWISGQMTNDNIDKLKDIEDQIMVVHLNSSNKEEGSHWDVHAEATFADGLIPVDKIKKIAKCLNRDNKIWILERASYDQVDKDVTWLRNNELLK